MKRPTCLFGLDEHLTEAFRDGYGVLGLAELHAHGTVAVEDMDGA
jgi:hypothetical protein